MTSMRSGSRSGRKGITRSGSPPSSVRLPVFMEKPPAPTARSGAATGRGSRSAGRAGGRRLHEAAIRPQTGSALEHGPLAGVRRAGQLPRPIHDGADLFRQGPGLYRLLSASLRALFRSRAAPDGTDVESVERPTARARRPASSSSTSISVSSSGAIGTLVMGTHQSRGTPMEWWQVMGDHRRVEVRNVHEVRYYRAPPFKVSHRDATLRKAWTRWSGSRT